MNTIVKTFRPSQLLLSVIIIAGWQATASASTFKSRSIGYCLDSNGNGQVYAMGCNGGSYQEWHYNGAELINYATGFCLDSNGAKQTYTMGCNGCSYQKWYRSGERFINVATGFCLDGNGAGHIYTHDCNGSNYQTWY